jgi:hypothetical protein
MQHVQEKRAFSGRWPSGHPGEGMSTDYERADFSVVVKDRGQPPNRWRWEIYRAGRSSAVEQSATLFPTMTAAHKAGKEALSRLLKQLENPDFE